jgi:histone H3/H4
MALSIKVIAAYKEATNSVVQVEKEARVALRTQAMVFAASVGLRAMKLMEAQKRKSLKLSDVVSGVAAQLAAEFPSMQVDNFIDAIFGSSVPYNVEKNKDGDKLLTYNTFTEEQTAHLFVKNNGHVQIKHKNTLRISEVERVLATTRKAHRTANAFLAICVDQYIQNLLSIAEARVTHDKKKRIKVEHLQLAPASTEVQAAMLKFQNDKLGEEDSGSETVAAATDSATEVNITEVNITEAVAAPAAPAVVEQPKLTRQNAITAVTAPEVEVPVVIDAVSSVAADVTEPAAAAVAAAEPPAKKARTTKKKTTAA